MVGLKLAIDFGSANLTILAENKGVVLNEPSIMICDAFSGEPIAMGREALSMKGRLPGSMKEVIPIKDGGVFDYGAACRMLGEYVGRICAGRLFRPGVMMAVPDTVNEIEKKTLIDVLFHAGAGGACLIPQSLACAVGAGIRLRDPEGVLICDIGGGITDCAVISMGNVAAKNAVRIGGNDLSKAIREYISHEYGLLIGESTAEEIKLQAGSAIYRTEEIGVIVTGKDVRSGLPTIFEISSTEVYWIVKSQVEEILNCIRRVLESVSVELLSDVMQRGIVLSGGSSNLFGLDRYIERNTGVPTRRAEKPECCAIKGLGVLIGEDRFLKRRGYKYLSSEENYGA